MKNLVMSLLIVLTASVSLAHPQDSDQLLRIGKGTKLSLIRDLNIPATPARVDVSFTRLVNDWEDSSPISCDLVLPRSSVDRLLRAGTEFEVGYVDTPVREGRRLHNWTVLESSQNSDVQIMCWSPELSLTIGRFRAAMSNLFRIQFPQPVEIQF